MGLWSCAVLCFCYLDLFLNRHFSDVQCPWCGVCPGGPLAQGGPSYAPLWNKTKREASWRLAQAQPPGVTPVVPELQ